METKKLNIDTEGFLIYSYICIDQQAWGPENDFEKIKHEFIKYTNLLNADNSRQLKLEEKSVFTRWKYAKMAINSLGISLFSSTADVNNYTILPDEYEKQYLYTYLINLYKKIYLKKIEYEFKKSKKLKNTRNKFIKFTKEIWAQEITRDETGVVLNKKIFETLKIKEIYEQVNNKYDILYKNLNIEKNKKTTIIISIMLVISIIFNIINFIALLKK